MTLKNQLFSWFFIALNKNQINRHDIYLKQPLFKVSSFFLKFLNTNLKPAVFTQKPY